MTNPYEILGLTPSATEQEVTRAYRKLAKKYHPDLNPGDKNAEKKMRELNAAYDQIQNGGADPQSAQDPRGSYGGQQGGYGGYGGQQGGYGGYGGGQQGGYGRDPFGFGFDDFFGFGRGQEQNQQRTRQRTYQASPRMARVVHFVNSSQFHEAWQVLTEMTDRDGEWYYFSAIINDGLGNRASALRDAQEAVRQSPNNPDFSALLRQYQAGGFQYQQTGQAYGFDMSNIRNMLIPLMLAPLICTCCCRY